MAKWFGRIGYVIERETKPGVWREETDIRSYYGDIIQMNRRTDSSEYLNDNINISNRFSIIADPFAIQNSQYMKFLEFMDVNWKITSVEMQYPRLIISVGGIYNGKDQA